MTTGLLQQRQQLLHAKTALQVTSQAAQALLPVQPAQRAITKQQQCRRHAQAVLQELMTTPQPPRRLRPRAKIVLPGTILGAPVPRRALPAPRHTTRQLLHNRLVLRVAQENMTPQRRQHRPRRRA